MTLLEVHHWQLGLHLEAVAAAVHAAVAARCSGEHKDLEEPVADTV